MFNIFKKEDKYKKAFGELKKNLIPILESMDTDGIDWLVDSMDKMRTLSSLIGDKTYFNNPDKISEKQFKDCVDIWFAQILNSRMENTEKQGPLTVFLFSLMAAQYDIEAGKEMWRIIDDKSIYNVDIPDCFK